MNSVNHKVNGATFIKMRKEGSGQTTKLDNLDLENQDIWLKQTQDINLRIFEGEHLSLSVPYQILIQRLLANTHNLLGLPRAYTELEIRGVFRVPMISVIDRLITISEESTSSRLSKMRSRWEEGAEPEQLINDLFSIVIGLLQQNPS